MDVTIGGIKVTVAGSMEDVAAALWDMELVENIGSVDAGEYSSRMLTATADTALWADATHEDDQEGTGEFEREIDELRMGYAPDFEDALPHATRSHLQEDVENFLRMAWLYLAADDTSPESAGHDFELTRNGHDAGFWDRGYTHSDKLTEIAHTFGSFGLEVSGHGEDTRVTGHHN